MKKRGRKKKQSKQSLEINISQPIDQDGPVLDLEKSIIKKLIRKGKADGHLTHELIRKSFPEKVKTLLNFLILQSSNKDLSKSSATIIFLSLKSV